MITEVMQYVVKLKSSDVGGQINKVCSILKT